MRVVAPRPLPSRRGPLDIERDPSCARPRRRDPRRRRLVGSRRSRRLLSLRDTARAMSQENVDLLRSIYAVWERGDYSSDEWADPEIETVIADGPTPGRWTGVAGAAACWSDFLNAWEEYRSEVEEYREIDDERVLV